MEETEKINFDEIGLLSGLVGENYKIVKSYLEKVDIESLKTDAQCSVIFPCIRCILSLIIEKGSQMEIFVKNKSLTEKILSMVDLDEIIFRSGVFFTDDLLTTVDVNLDFLDGKAEICEKFCENYVLYLIDKYSKNFITAK